MEVDNKLGSAILFSDIALSEMTIIFEPFLIAFSAEDFNSSSACFIPLAPPFKGDVASKTKALCPLLGVLSIFLIIAISSLFIIG